LIIMIENLLVSGEIYMEHQLMVGVSTRQNTANLVPFVQLGSRELVLLETDKAVEEGWGQRLARLVGERGGSCRLLQIGDGQNLEQMDRVLARYLEGVSGAVCWNFGGGQKLQQLALYSHFQRRLDQGAADWACYADPQARTTWIIRVNQVSPLQLENRRKSTCCQLTLAEILAVFGHKYESAVLLWKRTGPETGELAGEGMLDDGAVAWFDDYRKRREIFAYVVEQENNTASNDSAGVFPMPFNPGVLAEKKEFPVYFERLVQTRVARLVAADPVSHRVNEVWVNVHIHPLAGGDEIAEYDVVLVTDFGTIIPVDAKSYDFAKKDEDARLHNLNRLSGFYTDFRVVFPYYREDLQTDSVLQQDPGWRRLLRNPFRLQERQVKMFGYMPPGAAPLLVGRLKNDQVVSLDAGGEESRKTVEEVEVRPLDDLLEELRLKKE
jgi:hypothetical protein